MDIKDFLPKYPLIEDSPINPYDENFNDALFHKKEFYDNKLQRAEPFPTEKGMATKYQKTIARYMSSHTPYDSVILVHEMGSGKCVLPNTLIPVNNTLIRIEDIWDRYASKISIDNTDPTAYWAVPKIPISTQSLNETSKNIISTNIKYLYKQYINEPVRTIILENNKSLSLTFKHKVLTSSGWTNTFEVGTEIFFRNETNTLSSSPIKSISHYAYTGWVYDLEIIVHHNYVADTIITHNTCSAIGAIEQIRSENSTFKNAFIFAKGEKLLNNFQTELVEKCTAGNYIPANYNKLSEQTRTRRVNKLTKFYVFNTFQVFAKQIKAMSDTDIIDTYSDSIVVVDEVHNLRPQNDEDKDAIETYNQFHRFLHLIKNSKKLLLSGTPMKDSPEEIASVANLILPLDNQLPTGQDFFDTFMNQVDTNVYKMKKSKIPEFKEKLKGRISFLRETVSTIPIDYIGEKNYGRLKHFVVAPNTMSDFQTKYYNKAYRQDKEKSAFFTKSREASLFVFPDGSYGKDGFDKYIIKSKSKTKKAESYRLSPDLYKALKGDTDEDTLKNIKKYSTSYAEIITHILNTNGICFVYSFFVKGGGCILFSLLLELFGFSSASGTETTKALRYGILTEKTTSAKKIQKINSRANKPDNMNGDFIKVIIGSHAISEGFTFKNVIYEAIITPHWNYSETAQALARGIRLGSHNDLLKTGITPTVHIYQPVSIPKKGEVSIDLHMYETSEDKDITISSILRILMEIAFDCALNYIRNHSETGRDGSRECNYTTCNYKCDGVNMKAIEDGLDDKDLDYSTYQLYYANPNTPLIRKKIENIFRENHHIDLDSIIRNLQKYPSPTNPKEPQFTEEEIRSVLYTIQEESESDEFDYRNFLRLYSRTPVKKIMNQLELLFSEHFKLDLQTISDQFPNSKEFEIISALQTLINENIIISNKYGLPSYLREENNIYFLVNNITIKPDFYTEYYTRIPNISVHKSFSTIKEELYEINMPILIDTVCNIKDETDFNKVIKTLPSAIQEMFIEASIVAEQKKVKKNKSLRKIILKYYDSYIKDIDGTFLSTFLYPSENRLRCLSEQGWADCPDNYRDLLRIHELKRTQKIKEENPYGIMGKYNPETNSFCIVDFKQEKESKRSTSQDSTRSASQEDRRRVYSGKVCGASGWKLPELFNIITHRLKVDPPETYKTTETKETLIKRILKEKFLIPLCPKEELESSDIDTLRRILYWGTTKKDGGSRGIQPICSALQKWFKEHDLLEIDNMCGVQGKRRIGLEATVKTSSDKTFRLETFVPSADSDKYKVYAPQINKLISDSFNVKYKLPVNDHLWILLFSRKKLVACLAIDETNTLWNVNVAKNYRRQGIAQSAIKQATSYICKVRGAVPSLVVDNRDKDSKKLIKLYSGFGFILDKTDDRYTHMSYPCPD